MLKVGFNIVSLRDSDKAPRHGKKFRHLMVAAIETSTFSSTNYKILKRIWS